LPLPAFAAKLRFAEEKHNGYPEKPERQLSQIKKPFSIEERLVFIFSLPSVGINHIKFKGLEILPLSPASGAPPAFLYVFFHYNTTVRKCKCFFLNAKYLLIKTAPPLPPSSLQ
jgi:hypothetical protein